MFLTFSLFSCSENFELEKNNVETLSKKLNFVRADKRIEELSKNGNSRFLIVIVEWDEWGRASRNCASWGLCNANWFPQFKNNPNGGSTILEYKDDIQKYYIDILLGSPVPSDIDLNEFPIEIDEDFILNVEEKIGKNLTFKRGSYNFDNNLGNYGGFRIYLD